MKETFEVWYLPETVNCHYCGCFGRWRIKGKATGDKALGVCTKHKDMLARYSEKELKEEIVFRGNIR